MMRRRPPRPLRATARAALVVAAIASAAARAAPASSPTFARDVAPIVFARCAACHHPGESAPFNLLTYDDVRRRAKQIREVTASRFMPPWLPKHGDGDFLGERRLSDSELRTLTQWIDAGAPLGDKADLPPTPTFTEGWQTGTPDLILESPAYYLAPQQRDVFRNFVVRVPIDAPRWVESIELRPLNPRVTHHARLGVDTSNESARRDAEDPEPGYAGMAWAQDPDGQLVIWAPGMVANPGSPGVAWRLYPRATLVLHTHMQPSGKPEVVQFRIGIHFAKDAPKINPFMMRVGACDIDIPAGVKRHVVTDQYTLPIDVDVHTIFPHAHSLCQWVSVVAERPDGTRTPLITIDRFDENWHDAYRYRAPVSLPRGTRLVSTFTYDNTDENPRNRSRPARRVVYGSNVTDEMADVYLQVTPSHADQRAVLAEDYKAYALRSDIAGHLKSLELYPDEPLTQEALATCYVAAGQHDQAIAILERRLRTGKQEVYPVVSLGMIHLAKGDVTGGEALLRKSITMDPQYPLAWFGLGNALVAQKRGEPAEQAYRKVVELAPGFADARLSLADLLVQRGQLDQAQRECENALADSPDQAPAYLKLAEIHARRKDYDQSLNFFNLARRAAPYTHPAKVLLAVFCCGNGDLNRGLQLLQESRAEEPAYPVTPLVLGQLATRAQRLAEARDLFSAAAALPIPDNWPPSHRKRFLILLHSERLKLAEQLQDLPLARDALTEWLKIEPNNAQLQQMLNSLPPR